MKQILIKGVTICDRKYEFLAFSSSQLREHSCWMFASLNSDVSAESIRSGMGDFRDIRLLAKYSARVSEISSRIIDQWYALLSQLGQSFSTSIKGIALEKGQFDWTPDHEQLDEHGRNLCFTDGIGIIAPWMAAKLAKKVRLYNSDWCPSAFQIRCGGYKGNCSPSNTVESEFVFLTGMVCVDAANLIPDGDVGVYFRPSMNKFTANNHSIDVVRVVSNLSSAYLNRQIILLLSSLGIPDRTFLSLQKTMLDRSLALTQEPEKARQALRDLNEFGGNGCHAFLIDFLSQLGKHKEPFTQRLLYTFQKFLIKELRTKAKILVPNSWSLFGVVDETEILEYGQCFVQIHNTNRPESERKILTGPVVVTRNPCFHPGKHCANSDWHSLYRICLSVIRRYSSSYSYRRSVVARTEECHRLSEERRATTSHGNVRRRSWWRYFLGLSWRTADILAQRRTFRLSRSRCGRAEKTAIKAGQPIPHRRCLRLLWWIHQDRQVSVWKCDLP